MKKFVCIVLLLCLLVPLAGCLGKRETPDETTPTTTAIDIKTLPKKYQIKFLNKSAIKKRINKVKLFDGFLGLTACSPYLFVQVEYNTVLRYDRQSNTVDKVVDLGEPYADEGYEFETSFSRNGRYMISWSFGRGGLEPGRNYILTDFETQESILLANVYGEERAKEAATLIPSEVASEYYDLMFTNDLLKSDRSRQSRYLQEVLQTTPHASYAPLDSDTLGLFFATKPGDVVNLRDCKFVLLNLLNDKVLQEFSLRSMQ